MKTLVRGGYGRLTTTVQLIGHVARAVYGAIAAQITGYAGPILATEIAWQTG